MILQRILCKAAKKENIPKMCFKAAKHFGCTYNELIQRKTKSYCLKDRLKSLHCLSFEEATSDLQCQITNILDDIDVKMKPNFCIDEFTVGKSFTSCKHVWPVLQNIRVQTSEEEGMTSTVIFTLPLAMAASTFVHVHCKWKDGVENASECQQFMTCENDETCRRIEAVPIIGRRDEGRHIKCISCCSHGSVLPRECSEIKGNNLANGVYNIYPDETAAAVQVYCDMVTENGAWTVCDVILLHTSRNEIIHEITSHGNHELRIEMTDFDGKLKFAEYRVFGLGDEIGGYPLLISHLYWNCCAGSISTIKRITERNHEEQDEWFYERNFIAEYNGDPVGILTLSFPEDPIPVKSDYETEFGCTDLCG
ncbi:unnamed protein product [Mytilus edulis]|uniref:Fibrinogen C-terminal domain-containing protein n=1 Tax=Mytilus edulis TaxID=6550 RepID=A0A8S3Q4K2_MYTED|nr:unnamed protein product [Mytilus edulis]